MSKVLIFVFLFIPAKCHIKNISREEINLLIKSNKADDLVIGFYIIGEKKDYSYIPEVLSDASDPRITHQKNFYGISVYQSKMIAMKKMSGRTPPKEITSKPDSVIINFYSQWAKNSGNIY